MVQTGVQLLTGFLLTLPFQARFATLNSFQQNIYLITVILAVCSTAFLIAPVSLHRLLFRRHARARMVEVAHRLALTGMALLAASLVGVVLLIFDVVRGRTAGLVAGRPHCPAGRRAVGGLALRASARRLVRTAGLIMSVHDEGKGFG